LGRDFVFVEVYCDAVEGDTGLEVGSWLDDVRTEDGEEVHTWRICTIHAGITFSGALRITIQSPLGS
jgi:hypothetical protein